MSLSLFLSLPQPRTKQAACHQELRKKVEENSASSVLLAPQMSELLQNDDANVVVNMAPSNETEPGLATAKNNTFNLVTETFYEPINLTTTTTTTMKSSDLIPYALEKREPALTTLITPVNYINATEPKLTISSTVATLNENMKSIEMSATSATMTVKFQNNITTFAQKPTTTPSKVSELNETEKITKYTTNKIIGEKKVVTLKMPKKTKGTKFDFSVMSNRRQKEEEQAINVSLTITTTTTTTRKPLSLMEKDILATQQTVDKLQTIPTTTTTTTEHIHKHIPMHLELKDRHLIGTPLLTHKGENILVESDELRNLPKSSTIAAATTTTMNTIGLDISQIENVKETKWPRDITGLNEYDDKIATEATLQINKHIKLEHDKDKKKATLKIQKFLTTHSKYNAAKMLDTNDYDVSLIAETTITTEAEDTVTPLHKHSTVNMPIHYKQPHEMHTFHELQHLQQLQLQDKHALAINKDTQSASAHWLDERKPQSNGHPVFVILLSSVLFITLLFGLLHVYRCDLPWRRHLAPPRPHQRHLSDDDQHSFLHFQHNNAIHDELTATTSTSTSTSTSNVGYRQNYNSPLHHLHVHDLTLKADTVVSTASNNYTLASSSSSSSTGSYSSSPQSHMSSGFTGESCYVEMAPVVSTQNNLLPMELLSISSKNCRRMNEYSELNTLGSRLTEACSNQPNILVDSALTAEHTASSDALVNNEINLLQKARCNNTYKATITTKRTPTTRKFDLW